MFSTVERQCAHARSQRKQIVWGRAVSHVYTVADKCQPRLRAVARAQRQHTRPQQHPLPCDTHARAQQHTLPPVIHMRARSNTHSPVCTCARAATPRPPVIHMRARSKTHSSACICARAARQRALVSSIARPMHPAPLRATSASRSSNFIAVTVNNRQLSQ